MGIKKIAAAAARRFAGRAVTRVGRNEQCPCGSGRKYKHCCLEKDAAQLSAERSRSQAAKSNYIGGRATIGNRALEAANRDRRPKNP